MAREDHAVRKEQDTVTSESSIDASSTPGAPNSVAGKSRNFAKHRNFQTAISPQGPSSVLMVRNQETQTRKRSSPL